MSHQGNAVKMRRRRYFPTKHGGICVNAVTGNRYPYSQGSFESLRLYQVVDASGKCDNNGYVRGRWDQPNKTSNFFMIVQNSMLTSSKGRNLWEEQLSMA